MRSHFLTSWLTLALLSSEPTSTSHVCVTKTCSRLKSYIDGWIDLSTWNETCQNPFVKFCSLTAKGNDTLMQKKVKEATARRHQIFDSSHQARWLRHPTKIIRRTAQSWMRCIQTGNIDILRANITTGMQEYVYRTHVRVRDGKAIYMVPQIKLDLDEVSEKVHKMDRKKVCYHLFNLQYPHVIDRMYIERYLNRTVIENGVKFLNQQMVHVHRFLRAIATVWGAERDHEEKLIIAIGKLTHMKIKTAFPEPLLNDSVLNRMYNHSSDTLDSLVNITAHEWWTLPIYPEAVWYSSEENTLYITPLFFDADLFAEDLPIAWNWGAMFKVMQALLTVFQSADPEHSALKRLEDRTLLYPSIFHHLHHLPKITDEANVTLWLEVWSIIMIHNHVNSRPDNQRVNLVENWTNVDLFDFRVHNDECFQTSKKWQEQVKDYQLSTGRLHSYYRVQFYKLAKRIDRKCPQILFDK